MPFVLTSSAPQDWFDMVKCKELGNIEFNKDTMASKNVKIVMVDYGKANVTMHKMSSLEEEK